jgi:hypothetical protein
MPHGYRTTFAGTVGRTENGRPEEHEKWMDRMRHSVLRSFTDENVYIWMEQNAAKASKAKRVAQQFLQARHPEQSMTRPLAKEATERKSLRPEESRCEDNRHPPL